MEFYLGQIFLGGWNFAPRGSTECNGQLLAINSYQALFSLFGTMYGGDGRTTFGIPELRGRFAMHKGSGPGLTPRNQGAKFGHQSVTLTTLNMPAHNHALGGGLTVGGGKGATQTAAGSYLGDASSSDPFYKTGSGTGTINGTSGITMGQTGNNQAFDIMNPCTVIIFCCALEGIFPSRN